MRVVVVTAPEPLVSLDEAKAHLRVDGGDDDALITGLIAAASAHIDGPEGWLGRAIGRQTLELRLESFGTAGALWLPYPPAIDLVSIEYVDASGAEQAVSVDTCTIEGQVLRPIAPAAFPRAAWQGDDGETVRVRYRAGHEIVPPAIRVAILLMVGDFYRARESFAMTAAAKVPMSAPVDALLSPFRVWS